VRNRPHFAVAAGVLDAGLSSLASFAAGIFASRSLELTTLGAYALLFSATVLAAIVPTQLVFVPGETAAIAHPVDRRLQLLPRTLRLAAAPTVFAALAVTLAAIAVPASVSPGTVAALTATAVAVSLVSPVQDHVRRMLHLGGASSAAVVVSVVHLAIVAAALVALRDARGALAWLPFGALAAGNLVSSAVGVLLSRRSGQAALERSALPADVMRSGWWLLVVGIVAPATAFIVATIVAHTAGPGALGYAEASRIVAQPMLVFGTGLAAVLGPRVTEAAQLGEAERALQASRLFTALMLAAGLPYLLLVGHGWSWNPLADLVPNAYAVGGLVVVSVVANVANGMNFLQRAELLGAGRAAALARVDIVGNAVRVVVGATAGWLQAFAIPAGLVVLGFVRWLGYSRVLEGHYLRRAAHARLASQGAT
jgi:O-antigen/teichoic acid export membrane protein